MPWEQWPRTNTARKVGLDEDPLLEFLKASDPTEVKDLFVLVGIVGRAPRQNHWRVYLNYSLSEYFELSEKDVVYAGTNEDGRTRVWVEAGAPLRHVRQRPTRAEQSFYAPGRAAGQPGAGGEGYYLTGPIVESGDWQSGDASLDGGPVGTGCRCTWGTN